MFLSFTDPFGNKEAQAIDSMGLPLASFLGEYEKNVGGCLINGYLFDDWRTFVGKQGDRVEIILRIGEPASIIAGIVAALVSAALSAIVRALTPQPKKPKQNAKRSEAFGIAGFNNTTGQGIPKFVVYGENDVHGHVIGSGAVLSPDGKEMFANILYFMGDTGLDGYESIGQITIDETDVAQFPEVQVETRLGTAGQAVIPYFENVNQLFSDNRALEFNRDTQTGTPIIYTTRGSNIQRATIFFHFPSGLYRINAKGRERGAGALFHIEIKKNSDPSFVLYQDANYSEQSPSPHFKTFEINFSSAEKWDIRITKYGEVGFSQGEPFFNDVVLFNVQETVFTTRNYPGTALLALINIPARKVRSLEGMRVKARVKGKKVKVWDGVNYVTQYTRQRCWITRDMMTHSLVGMGNEIADDEINDQQWLESQAYYQELVTGHAGNEVRDFCDLILAESQWDWEWIKSVIGEGRGRVIPSGDKWKYVIDRPGSPNLLYAEPGNMIEGSLTIELGQQDRPFNQVIAEFRDATNDYKPEIAPPITDPDIGSDPIVQESRRYDTITRESQVQRENMIILKREKLERRRFQFISPRGAIVSEPLDIDYLSERSIGDMGAYTGFLPAGSTVTTIVLPFPCKLEAGETYALIIRHNKDNTVEYRNVSTASGTWAQIAVTSPFNAAPEEGSLFALGIENVDHILTRAQDLSIDNEGRVRQLRTEYIPAVYTADALPPRAARRFFRLGDQPPPIPLADARVREEIVLNRDGSIRSVLIFDVTPGLPAHSGIAQGGNTNFITLAAFEPPLDDYFNTAVLRIVEGTGVGQEKKIVDYLGAIRQAIPESDFAPAPDGTSIYEIEWIRFGEFGGFKIEQRDDVTMNFVDIARAPATHWEMDGRGAGPGAEEFRFTPYSLAAVENVNGRWIRSLVLVGDLSAPAAPVSIILSAYLKTVGATVTLNRPVAEDFSAVEIEFWRDAVDSGTLLKTARYGSAPDNAATGTMTIEASATLADESYGAVIWARARSVDRSNNASGWVNSPAGVTLNLPPDFGPDLIPPAVPTGLTLNTGVQPDPVTGIPVVFLDISWDPNTETDISQYEVQYRRQGSPSWTVRMISHPEVSTRELGVVGNTLYEAKVQAIDQAANKSGFTAVESIITARDTTPPAPPADISTIDGYQQVLIRFMPPADIDFAAVEIWHSETNDRATAAHVGDSNEGAISYADTQLANDLTLYYWLRSKDLSGNTSNFVPGDTAGVEGHTLRITGNDVVLTQALVTQSAQIANAIINNAHISNLSADKITAGALQAAYTLGVGAGILLDGVNRNIIVQDQQPRTRVQLGRLGPASTDYGLQIFGANGALWFSLTQGLLTNGLAPNAASQVSSFWDSSGFTFAGGAGGRHIAGQVSLITVGGPVIIHARYNTQNFDNSDAHHQLELWRDGIGVTFLEGIQYKTIPGDQILIDGFTIDFPPAGFHTWYLVDYDWSGGGVTPFIFNRRMQVLETKR